jgi:hypothetical protein
MRGAEAVGGRLFLTDRRLIFESHALNIQRGPALVDLADVNSATKVWTRVFGLVPLAPNGLAVASGDGQELRFVVSGRSNWLKAIEEQRAGAGQSAPAA